MQEKVFAVSVFAVGFGSAEESLLLGSSADSVLTGFAWTSRIKCPWITSVTLEGSEGGQWPELSRPVRAARFPRPFFSCAFTLLDQFLQPEILC